MKVYTKFTKGGLSHPEELAPQSARADETETFDWCGLIFSTLVEKTGIARWAKVLL